MSAHEDVWGMAFTSQAAPTTHPTQPWLRAPKQSMPPAYSYPHNAEGSQLASSPQGGGNEDNAQDQCLASGTKWRIRKSSWCRCHGWFYISVTRQGACLSQEVSFNILKCGREGGKNCHTVLAATPACPVWCGIHCKREEKQDTWKALRSKWHVCIPLLWGEKVRSSYCTNNSSNVTPLHRGCTGPNMRMPKGCYDKNQTGSEDWVLKISPIHFL